MTQNNDQYGKVSREIRAQVLYIGLDRAHKRNAFDSHMINDLAFALTEYENDADLRCAVIFAHGDHFTAGLDLMEIQDKISTGLFDAEKINPWGTTGWQRTKPLIVVVHGICYTAGIELMLNADIVIASENTTFAQLEVQRGILPFGGATVRFVRNSGWLKAMPYLLSGITFDAIKANELNLVTEVYPQDQCMQRAEFWAQAISSAAPLAVQATLKSAQEALSNGQEYAFEQLLKHLQPLMTSQDAVEGVMAMLQKRPAQFKGQ